MANMYGTICSSSSPPPESDDISFFLHQIFLRSSSSPSTMPVFFTQQMQSITPVHLPPGNQSHQPHSSVADSSSRLHSPPDLVFSSAGDYFSSSVGTIDHDTDEYDCESEEGLEAIVEEASEKRATRNSSKRSRAAEVHNLSEKRRRSKINEKMKALQKLIPNSNKTDKASMLDEAIEYLKQLQLQVQMLTMRNGLSLYPMCRSVVSHPSQLAHTRMGGLLDAAGSSSMNMTTALPVNQEQFGHNLSNIISSATSFGLELGPSIQAQHGHFHHPEDVKEICREDLFPFQQVDVNRSLANTSSGSQVENLECNPILSSDLDR